MGIIPAFAGNTNRKRSGDHSNKDHPRIRGEHIRCRGRPCRKIGSSPHSRGTQGRVQEDHWGGGIIPAFAGNTHLYMTTSVGKKDHPRIRGEHQPQVLRRLRRRGSSPHSRGTHYVNPKEVSVTGIIPAFAGNTLQQSFCYTHYQDHPRIRGEHNG